MRRWRSAPPNAVGGLTALTLYPNQRDGADAAVIQGVEQGSEQAIARRAIEQIKAWGLYRAPAPNRTEKRVHPRRPARRCFLPSLVFRPGGEPATGVGVRQQHAKGKPAPRQATLSQPALKGLRGYVHSAKRLLMRCSTHGRLVEHVVAVRILRDFLVPHAAPQEIS